MTDELFAYLMDDLPPERRAAVDERLAADPAWRRELKRLQDCLAEASDPCKCLEEPPQDLVQRTCFLVEHAGQCDCDPTEGGRGAAASNVAAFTATASCAGAASKSWTLADATVGAGILLIVGALVAPALYETRATSRRIACENNLRVLGGALYDYQLQNGQRLPAIMPGQAAGEYTLALVESGLITRDALRDALLCPESQLAQEVSAGRVVVYLPTREELRAARDEMLTQIRKSMGGSYAYQIGYRDQNSVYRQRVFTSDQRSPLLSDAPIVSVGGVRSKNHGGDGQNVLYESGGVRFRRNCVMTPTRDHLFLNALNQQAAGLGEDDFVLCPSDCGPNGRLVAVGNNE